MQDVSLAHNYSINAMHINTVFGRIGETKTINYKTMAQQTAVEWLREKLFTEFGFAFSDNILEQAKQNQKDQIIEHLIAFQIYLNNKELITNHDWDFEKLAKQYIKKEYK